jgi:hypothetical protein
MANEIFKTINTRIALRTGDYDYWTKGAGKDIELRKGEVCVCTVAVTDNEATTAPTVLFKVADANGKKFTDLKWVSGLAADVYSWGKLTGDKVFAKDGTGNVVSGITYDATLNDGKGGFKYTTEAVATAEGLKDLQEAVSAIEKDITDSRKDWAKDDNDNTTYQFSIPDSGEDKGKLLVQKKEIGDTNWTKVDAYDFITPSELTTILGDYALKSELHTPTTVAEGEGIEVSGTDRNYIVSHADTSNA